MMLNSEARERVLDAAERLFAERGYTAVKLTDIAAALDMKHASLYHHVKGKAPLFVEVMERRLKRHQQGIETVMAQHAGSLRDQLIAAAGWMAAQPPLDLLRMTQSDLPELPDKGDAQRLSQLALEAMIEPIAAALYAARARGEIDHPDLGLVAGGLFGMLQSLHLVPEESLLSSRLEMATTLIDVILHGLLKR